MFDVKFVFANTGAEHENTLKFVDQCDKAFGLNVVWLEADVQGSRSSTKHKIVNYATASRNGQPYIDVVRKYGLPNIKFPHCTREMKRNVMFSYRKSVVGYAYFAIGIRCDEIDRLPATGDDTEHGLIYPLIKYGITKQVVNEFWASQEFDLDLPEHGGNCVFCFKKSDNKLYKAYSDYPEYFDIAKQLERETKTKLFNKMYRGKRTTQELINTFDITDTTTNGCSDSCEAF